MVINIEDTCSICEYCIPIGIKELDCCDMYLYKCEIRNEVLDEFHVERKACKDFIAQDWVSG